MNQEEIQEALNTVAHYNTRIASAKERYESTVTRLNEVAAQKQELAEEVDRIEEANRIAVEKLTDLGVEL